MDSIVFNIKLRFIISLKSDLVKSPARISRTLKRSNSTGNFNLRRKFGVNNVKVQRSSSQSRSRSRSRNRNTITRTRSNSRGQSLSRPVLENRPNNGNIAPKRIARKRSASMNRQNPKNPNNRSLMNRLGTNKMKGNIVNNGKINRRRPSVSGKINNLEPARQSRSRSR